MKTLVHFILILALTACSKESVEEHEINQRLALMVQGEEKQDADLIGSLFAPDATLINLSASDTREGSEDILAYYKENFDEREDATVTLASSAITVKEPQTAVAVGKMDLTFSTGEKESIAFKALFQKGADNVWLVKRWTEATLSTAPSFYEQLKGLDWLVGSWTNGDDDSTFTSKNQWDKYKNFLTQSFSLDILGQKELFGRQIIGWDANEEKIRSWIFDSEGGFGACSWYQEGDSWYVPVRYTMPDGSLASSTQIYKKIDDATYQFSTTNREINGQILPNIGPFTLTKG